MAPEQRGVEHVNGGLRETERKRSGSERLVRGCTICAGQKGDQTPALPLPFAVPAALYTTLLSSGDLVMEDSLALRTEPISVCDRLKSGTKEGDKTSCLRERA